VSKEPVTLNLLTCQVKVRKIIDEAILLSANVTVASCISVCLTFLEPF
jgi:hypothetical protein